MMNLINIADEFIMYSLNEEREYMIENADRPSSFGKPFYEYRDVLNHIDEADNDFIAYLENPNNGYRHLMNFDRCVKSYYVRYCNKAYKKYRVIEGYNTRICQYSDSLSEIIGKILTAVFVNNYDDKYEKYLIDNKMIDRYMGYDEDEEEDEEDEEDSDEEDSDEEDSDEEDSDEEDSDYNQVWIYNEDSDMPHISVNNHQVWIYRGDTFNCCVCLEDTDIYGFNCDTCKDGKMNK